MLKVLIHREESSDLGTKGTLTIPSLNWSCKTLELPWRDNKPQHSCIEKGTYRATQTLSPHFQEELYHLNDTNGRQNVLIHVGNFAGDTEKGYVSDVLGCILLGQTYATLETHNKTQQMGITSSRTTVDHFMKLTNGEELSIEIT